MPPKGSKRAPQSSPRPKPPPPPPFTSAPSSLTPFLDTLNENHIYIAHIDTHPAAYKKRIFTIPVVLNAFFALLLFLRAYFAVPKYASLFKSTLGFSSQDAVDTEKAAWKALAWIVVKRGVMFLFDFLLIRIVGSWPWSFFIEGLPVRGEENPCSWRWKLGFREKEIVVRMSRRWGREELLNGEKEKKGGESPFWRTRVLPACQEEWIRAKTGYLMMGKEWDLDFGPMVRLQRAIDSSVVREADVDGLVIGWWDSEGKGEGEWVVWKFREAMQEAEEVARDQYGMTEEEGNRQMGRLRVSCLVLLNACCNLTGMLPLRG